ncbi:hypothetical protein ABZ671_21400 [Micromonospora sp. NPDC006766]|uniref:hypothetical protein n=1 Tax=Micromonospora sp. NPDC006766 TaxID=3154778 RepID=UPI0034067D59
MPAAAWAVVAALTGVLLATAGWRWRVRARRTPTRAERLAAARKAARQLRHSGPRRHRDTFQGDTDLGDRRWAAHLSHSDYGGAGGSSDGGSY